MANADNTNTQLSLEEQFPHIAFVDEDVEFLDPERCPHFPDAISALDLAWLKTRLTVTDDISALMSDPDAIDTDTAGDLVHGLRMSLEELLFADPYTYGDCYIDEELHCAEHDAYPGDTNWLDEICPELDDYDELLADARAETRRVVRETVTQAA